MCAHNITAERVFLSRAVTALLAVVLAIGCAPASTPSPNATTAAASATSDPRDTTSTSASASPSSVSSWRRIADIPTARSEVAAVLFRGGIYVIGGFGGGNVVERYDPSTDRWSRVPDLPMSVDHAMAAAIDDGDGAGIYVLGGNDGAPTARAFSLAPGATTWREIARMPGPRSQAAAAVLSGTIF